MTSRKPIRPFEIDPNDQRAVKLAPQAEPIEIAPDTVEIIEPENARKRGWRRLLWPAVTLGIIGTLALQAYLYIAALFAASTVLGGLAAAFLSLFAIGVFGFVWREFADLRRIRQRAHIRDTAQRLAQSELHGESQALIAELDQHLKSQTQARRAIADYRKHSHDALSDRECLELYERKVMAPLDKEAYRTAMRASRDIGLLTALSPLGVLDSLLVLWRTTMMIRQIAKLYGLTLGPAATWQLMRTCLRNAAIAGVADMVSDAALEHVGASLTSLLSARAGQGAGNALLAARFSTEVIRQSRPLPYMALEPPSLKQIRGAIFDQERQQAKAEQD